jgi:hypothetical protein
MNLLALALFSAVIATSSGVLMQSSSPAASLPEGVKLLIDNQRITICDVTWTKGKNWSMESYPMDTLVVPLLPVNLKITSQVRFVTGRRALARRSSR